MAMNKAVAVDTLAKVNRALEEISTIDRSAITSGIETNLAAAETSLAAVRDPIVTYLATAVHTTAFTD